MLGVGTENHLIRASTWSDDAYYAYDPLERRKSKTLNSNPATLYLSAGDQEIAEYDGSTLLRRMVYGPNLDETVATVTPAGVKTYLHADAGGSTIATTDASGVLADRYVYDEYGQPKSGSAGAANRYTGRRIDPEFGFDFYHYRARTYFPGWGRFNQPDPIGYEGGMNLYTYVNNDPLNLTDPMGKLTENWYNSGWGIGALPLDNAPTMPPSMSWRFP